MSSDSSFADVLARLRSHDNSAATEVLRRYANQLIAEKSADSGTVNLANARLERLANP
jgi:hypothetical protein